jgi:hypothetical protein
MVKWMMEVGLIAVAFAAAVAIASAAALAAGLALN